MSKCCRYFGSCLIATIFLLGIVSFFMFLGSAYELTKCYLRDKAEKDKETADQERKKEARRINRMISFNLQNNILQDNVIANKDQRETENQILQTQKAGGDINVLQEISEQDLSGGDYCIIIMICICGVFLQPFYLCLYLTYMCFEIYRRINCFHFYML